MTVTQIAEHNVCLDLLPANAKILDIGCRGFLFTNHFRSQGRTVFAVDLDKLDGDYHQVAISDRAGRCGIKRTNDPQATSIQEGDEVEQMTLHQFSEKVDVDFFDLIKIDVEGSEVEIIQSLTKAPAKQISIEFHLHTGIYDERTVQSCVDKLISLGYEIASHEKTNQHGAGLNYWSSLFVLK